MHNWPAPSPCSLNQLKACLVTSDWSHSTSLWTDWGTARCHTLRLTRSWGWVRWRGVYRLLLTPGSPTTSTLVWPSGSWGWCSQQASSPRMSLWPVHSAWRRSGAGAQKGPEAAGPPPQRWRTPAHWCDHPHLESRASFQLGCSLSGTEWKQKSKGCILRGSPGHGGHRRPLLGLQSRTAGQSKAPWSVSVAGCWRSWDAAASGQTVWGGRRHCWWTSQRRCCCLPWPPGERQRRPSCCRPLRSLLPN